MNFLIKRAKVINIGDKLKSFKAGEYEAEDEAEIKALMGAKDVSFEEPEKREPLSEEEQLKSVQAEYEAKLGKKPHHKSGVEKLREEIKAFEEKGE